MEERSRRTCVKCRLHGNIVVLKNHKNNCPYKFCSCERCCAHNKNKEEKRLTNQPEASSEPSTCSTQTVLDVAEVAMASKVVAKNMSATDKKMEQRKKQLQKHRELYAKVNAFSQDISSAVPEMNPLQVMKTALQLHQLGQGPTQSKPKEQDRERKPVQVMPDLPTQYGSKPYVLEETKLDHLCGAFPEVSRPTLAALLIHERGGINKVITRMMCDEESSVDESSTDVITKEELAVADVAAKTTITIQELNSILDNVAKQESTRANIISFHSRARERAPAATCTSVTGQSTENKYSLALSSQQGDNRICPSCLNFVECNFCFCPHCGQLMKKTTVVCSLCCNKKD